MIENHFQGIISRKNQLDNAATIAGVLFGSIDTGSKCPEKRGCCGLFSGKIDCRDNLIQIRIYPA